MLQLNKDELIIALNAIDQKFRTIFPEAPAGMGGGVQAAAMAVALAQKLSAEFVKLNDPV